MTENAGKTGVVANLFRPEAVRAQAGTGFGDIVILQPMSTWFLTFAAMSFAAGVVSLLVFGAYSQPVIVNGSLKFKEVLLEIDSPSAGFVKGIAARVGESVAKGDLLFTLEQDRLELNRARDAGKTEAPDSEINGNAEGAEGSSRIIRIVAPEGGRVANILVKLGQRVSERERSLDISTSQPRAVAFLFVPKDAVPLLQPGDRMNLRLSDSTGRTFKHQTGTISAIAAQPVVAGDHERLSETTGSSIEVQVLVDSVAFNSEIHSGMPVESEVVLERRRLIDWVIGSEKTGFSSK